MRLLIIILSLVACGSRVPSTSAGAGSGTVRRPEPPATQPPPLSNAAPRSATPTCAEGRDDTPRGLYGYGEGGYGPGGVRTGWRSTSICFGDIASDEGDDVTAIRSAVADKAIELKVCYEHVLDETNSAGGLVTAALVVLRDGRVKVSSVKGFHAKVDSCVAHELATIAFPAPPARESRVTIPITFRPPTKK